LGKAYTYLRMWVLLEITGPSALSYAMGGLVMLAGVVVPLTLMVLRNQASAARMTKVPM